MAEPLRVAQSEADVVAKSLPADTLQGYDSVTGAGRNTAVTGRLHQASAKVTAVCTICESMSELSTALEVNQSLTVAFGKVGNIDQKMQFIDKLKVTTHSVEIVVYAKCIKFKETCTDVKLKGDPPPRDKLKEFFKGYGDSYLKSRQVGGEYYAVYTFYSQTQEQQTELVAGLKAGGIYSGVTVDAALQTKVSNYLSSNKTRTFFEQNVSGVSKVILPAGPDICEFARKFPDMEMTMPETFTFEVEGYENVPGFGDFQSIVNSRRFFVDPRNGLVNKLVDVQELEDEIELIEKIYDLCGGYNDEKLEKVKREAREDHDKIDLLIQKWEDDPTQTFEAPKLPSLAYGIPSLVYTVDKSPAYGGNGGSPFDDVSGTSLVPDLTRVTAVQLRTGWVVNKITTWYRTFDRNWQAAHGKDDDGGSDRPKLDLASGEVITKISGNADKVIWYLTITTNRGRETKGGGPGGSPFAWSPPPGSFAFGFAGRSGSYLDQIQVVYGTFLPAVWQRRREDPA
jgi:hypothetical protein